VVNREHISDALRFWEMARVPYNLVLVGIVVWFVWQMLSAQVGDAWGYVLTPWMLILAVLANVAFCVVYPVDLFVQASSFRDARGAWRAVLWLTGTALASAFAWLIMDAVATGASPT
jgi:hypothetical protein